MTDNKELAKQMRENAVKNESGNIICSPELWEEIASIIERAIIPPCKVGAVVYLFYPVRKSIYEAVVDEICLTEKSNFIVTRDLYFNRRQSIFFEQIGKTVFLTKEEAEEKLKELSIK